VNAESAIAHKACVRRVEMLRAAAFSEVFARFNATTTDDPGSGSSPGAGFAVQRLQAEAGDADGLPGEIVFPTPSAAATILTEAGSSGFPGMPRDLNMDGDTSDTAIAAYRILPVIVRVRWRGAGGTARVAELSTTLGEP
jgi:hypothetical protein